MDYLDPKKERQHRRLLFVGYLFMTVAIGFATLILVYIGNGFGIAKNGDVIQNGLVFFSSQPSPAKIYINNKLNRAETNSRLVIPSGLYNIRLARDGYREWQRKIDVGGGTVQHFDYPLLIPNTLTTTKVSDLTALPAVASQSPDRRWLLLSRPGTLTDYSLFDLKTPTKVTSTVVSLPATLLTKATKSETITPVEWADDNQHVLLKHVVDDKTEFILLDRLNPDQSVNLSQTLNTTVPVINFADKKFDQYFLYDSGSHLLQTASLRAPTPTTLLAAVLAYKTYGTDVVMYATDNDTTAGKVAIRLLSGKETFNIRTFPSGSNYYVDITKYSGKFYAVAGSSNDSKAYIYKDPIAQLRALPNQAVVPTQVLRVSQLNFISFSNNAQYVMGESGNRFAVYDIENKNGYNYIANLPLDAPQAHAAWMDGNRLTYVANGKSVILDYDNANQQVLVPTNASTVPFFAPNFAYLYTIAPSVATSTTPAGLQLGQTPLLTVADR